MPLLPLLAAATLIAPVQTPKWCFIVSGDGRSQPGANRPEDKNGINTLITSEIRDAVFAEKAKFLMWTGDLVLGAKTSTEFEKQLTTWRDIMMPLYDAKIPILACRGNHESGSEDSEHIWNRIFAGRYSMPLNGPGNEKNLTFYYGKGGVLVMGLDQYRSGKEVVNQAWIDKTFATYKKKFVFAMGHEPAFMDGAHKDTMDADPAKRDEFWKSYIKAGGRVFFAGHDHLYDHMAVTRKGSDPGPVIHQIVAGTAGAPFYKEGEYKGNNTEWNLKRVKHIDNTYGYVLVEIEGNKATISFKGRTGPGQYEVMDSFSYTSSN